MSREQHVSINGPYHSIKTDDELLITTHGRIRSRYTVYISERISQAARQYVIRVSYDAPNNCYVLKAKGLHECYNATITIIDAYVP